MTDPVPAPAAAPPHDTWEGRLLGGVTLLKRRDLHLILLAGLVLRAFAFTVQGPFNNDDHYEVVRYIHDHGRLPAASQCVQAYHPPLYYVIASVFVTGSPKTVQALSLVFSMATLYLIGLWLASSTLFPGTSLRKHCFMLAALLPQFVMFGNYVSNDSLAILIGAALAYQSSRFLARPGRGALVVLAVILGLGLLTKGSFIAVVPAVALVVLRAALAEDRGWRAAGLKLAVLLAIAGGLGATKYAANVLQSGRTAVPNVPLVAEHSPFYRLPTLWEMFIFGGAHDMTGHAPFSRGVSSLVDVNVFKLVAMPTQSEATKHSIPLLFYATFWYQYIPESNLLGNLGPLGSLGRCIYVLALLPTLLMAIGLLRRRLAWRALLPRGALDPVETERATLMLSLLTIASMVVGLGLTYDLWSWFQARYLFIAFPAILVLYHAGLERLDLMTGTPRTVAEGLLTALHVSFGLYFVTEAFQLFWGA